MDEKGYVLSGLGFLLLIPAMMLIPVALSVTNQSSELPNTFVKSDSAFYANKNIQRDMSLKLSNFLDNIDNQTLSWNNPGQLANNITALYTTSNTAFYNMNNGSGLDNLSITPNYPHQQPQILYQNSTYPNLPTNGTIPLKNGIMITYQFDGNSTLSGHYYFNYTVYPTINSTIISTKKNDGQVQNYVDTNSSASITIDAGTSQSNAIGNVNSFFTSLKSLITPCCYV